MDQFKLATVVVCFHPGQDLKQNIMSYSQISDVLILWNNTPNNESFLRDLSEMQYITVMKSNKNEGLAFPYNRAYELAVSLGCTHIMTMDQDSCFENAHEYRKYIEEKVNEGYMGRFAPVINSTIRPGIFRFIPYAVQSGCVFPCSMIGIVGPFREDFFISMVDVEMQLRAGQFGYTIMEVCGVNMRHQIGSNRQIELLGKMVSPNDYGPMRNYYDSRNRILMWHEFPDDYNLGAKIAFLFGRLKQCLKIFLIGENKWQRISAIIRGTWNGLTNQVIPYDIVDLG